MKNLRFLVPLGMLIGINYSTACGSSSSDSASKNSSPGLPADQNASSLPGVRNGGADSVNATEGAGSPKALPPEQKLESSYGAPVATGKYVWIANPTSGKIAYINAQSLEVHVADAGNAPTYVAAIPDAKDDVALVLNVLSHDATLLRASGAAISSRSLAVASGGNAWGVSPDGHWAIAWTDARQVGNASAVDGFQELTVLHLTPGAETSTTLTVGYRPVAISFDKAARRAFAVTQDGITVISLSGNTPVVIKNVKISEKPTDDTRSNSVSITSDGGYALVRHDGVNSLGVISLSNGVRTDVPLPAPATDLQLTANGAVAVVVVRETSQISLLPVPNLTANLASPPLFKVPDVLIGSVSLAEKSSLAFFYTSAVPNPYLTVLDTASAAPAPRTILLRAPVQAVFPTADGSYAVVLHNASSTANGFNANNITDNTGGGPGSAGGPASVNPFGSAYPAALSVVPIAHDLPAKIIGLHAPPVAVAMSPENNRVLIAARDKTQPNYWAYIASMPSLQVDSYPLASPPIAAGIVAGASRGYVAQEHPDGRITFFDFKTGDIRTITGFELASQVVDGSSQP